MDFKTKAITRDKENKYIILKGVVQQEHITIINIYSTNISALKYKQNIGGL